VCAGRVLVFGGRDVKYNFLASVEMCEPSTDQGWQILPTPMFAADADFQFVSLPIKIPTTTTKTTTTKTTTTTATTTTTTTTTTKTTSTKSCASQTRTISSIQSAGTMIFVTLYVLIKTK
jgi:hypothetical protein